VPVLRQLSAVECGAACLAMVLSYHGRATSVAECRAKCGPGRGGLTAKAIAEAAREYGLRVRAYSLEPENFHHLTLPVIAHWNFNHFIVVDGWSRDAVAIVDPASGRRTLSRAEFDEGFTGVVLTFEPGPHFEPRAGVAGRPLLTYLRSSLSLPGAKGVMARLLAASLVLQLLGLVFPFFTKLLVDHVLPFQAASMMNVVGVGLLMLVATQSALSYLRSTLLVHLRGRLDSHLMLNFFEHLLALPYSFFQQRSGGDVLMRLGSVGFIREVLTNNMLSILLDGFFALVYLTILLCAAPLFGLLAAGLGAAQILLTLGTRRRVTRLMERELAAKATEQGYLVEAVSGISMLKASGTEDRALERWSDLFYNQLNVSLERERLSARLDAAMGTLRVFSPLFLLWVGAWHVLGGDLSLGSMLALNAVAASFLSPISSLVMSGKQLMLVGAHLDRIADVMSAAPEQAPGEERVALELAGRIEVKNLSFQYDPHAPLVLRDISFVVEPGQKLAVVGATGSGKSTLTALLLGLRHPTHGEVLYDGVPLDKFNYRALRRQIGVVLQEPVLFSGSLRQNLLLNNPAATLGRLEEVVELAGLGEEVRAMQMGLETPVAERGEALSGGQRQRVAIARALLNAPAVLILDEATSHLDAVTEAAVDRNLSGLACTRVVIAHRLSTVINADQILVLHEGCLVERGTHDELMAAGGHYAALVRTGDSPSSAPVRAAAGVHDFARGGHGAAGVIKISEARGNT
jgi:ABC-type bacteriocin/lantibiotic exporter with double-glycine peptidase domain